MTRDALDRTLLLMRDEPIGERVGADVLLDALTSTVVVLAADEETLRSDSSRVSLSTIAQLAARSGAKVFVAAPETESVRPLAPLQGTSFLAGLVELGADLFPGCSIEVGRPGRADVAIVLGASEWDGAADVSFRVSASNWSAVLAQAGPVPAWSARDWPFGGLAAAALAAAEVYKSSARKLRDVAQDPAGIDELFAPAKRAHIQLADEGLVGVRDLGAFDLISGGAITQSMLYALARIPDVRGDARLFEPDRSELSNLNRCMLLRWSRVGLAKAADLASQDLGGIRLTPIESRFEGSSPALRDHVLVGVDHIPSRWVVQGRWPPWLGVGATSHYGALVSHHEAALPCAACLHPHDDSAGGPIPTAAFVSFWAGLLLAVRFVRHRSGDRLAPERQQEYVFTLRPESVWSSPVARRQDCRLGCGGEVRRVA